jgi:dihydrofolate reductase
MARRLVYYVACTVDGFIASRDGSFDFFPFAGEHFQDLASEFPETFPTHVRHLFGATRAPQHFDTVLMGRATYEIGLRAGITSPYGVLRQFVVSASLPASPDPGVRVYRENPLELVRVLKQEEGMDIWLCGGAKLAGTLLPEIDELILKINPIILGAGIPLFEGSSLVIGAVLKKYKQYPNGFVLARYKLGAD